MTTQSRDIVYRLRELASTKPGEPIPEWLVDENNGWGVRLSALAAGAAAEIDHLRSQVDRIRAILGSEA